MCAIHFRPIAEIEAERGNGFGVGHRLASFAGKVGSVGDRLHFHGGSVCDIVVWEKSAMETLHDIFGKAGDADVTDAVIRLYNSEEDWLPKAIVNTLAELRRLVPETGGFAHELQIEVGEPLLPEDPPYWEVWCCRADEAEERYSLSLSPWEEWLAVQVPDPLLARMPSAEIAAHCLWEMTFYGWTQEKIAEERTELNRRLREIDEGTVELIPWEEVKARLDATIEEARKKRDAPMNLPNRRQFQQREDGYAALRVFARKGRGKNRRGC